MHKRNAGKNGLIFVAFAKPADHRTNRLAYRRSRHREKIALAILSEIKAVPAWHLQGQDKGVSFAAGDCHRFHHTHLTVKPAYASRK